MVGASLQAARSLRAPPFLAEVPLATVGGAPARVGRGSASPGRRRDVVTRSTLRT